MELDEAQAELRQRCVDATEKKLSADQLRGLELVCSGRDGLILIRTGGGKTLLWQLPALQGGGLTVVVVPSVALALDLKASTDELLAGTGTFCCYDERSENGEAAPSAEVPPATSAPSAAEAALARMARAALAPRPWRCETECTGCAPPLGKPRGKCYYKCGICRNCTSKKNGKCSERSEREKQWAAAEAMRVAAAASGVTDVTDVTDAAVGTPATGGGGQGARTRSRLDGRDRAADDCAANDDARPVTEAEVRGRVGTAPYAALDSTVRVIITTPEALCGESRESLRLRFALERCGWLRRFVIDEAHCRSANEPFRSANRSNGDKNFPKKNIPSVVAGWSGARGSLARATVTSRRST